MKIKTYYLLLLSLLIGLGSCGSREEKVKDSIQSLNSFTNQLLIKVSSKGNLIDGIVEGQEFLNNEKTAIVKKINLTKHTNRAQVTDKTMKAWQKAVVMNRKRIQDLQIAHVGQARRNPQLSKALNKLVKDYGDLLQK